MRDAFVTWSNFTARYQEISKKIKKKRKFLVSSFSTVSKEFLVLILPSHELF